MRAPRFADIALKQFEVQLARHVSALAKRLEERVGSWVSCMEELVVRRADEIESERAPRDEAELRRYCDRAVKGDASVREPPRGAFSELS